MGDAATAFEAACSAEAVDTYRGDAAAATQVPYLAVAIAVGLMAVAVFGTPFPAFPDAAPPPAPAEGMRKVATRREVAFLQTALFQ